jgi:hypothetical protein
VADMGGDEPRSVPWHDPLMPPPGPIGTGSGAYVEQPEPRPNPLTVEGEIAAFGQFARGAVRATGWRGTLARAFIFWVLAVIALGLVLEIAVVLH